MNRSGTITIALMALALAGCQPSEKKAETPAASPAEGAAATPPAATTQGAAAAVSGQQVYTTNCASCHQANGQGMPGAFPPIAGSEYANGDPVRHIKVVLNGLTGPVTVAGKQFNGAMPPWKQLSDAELAAVITYERTSWGNTGGAVTPADVKAQR